VTSRKERRARQRQRELRGLPQAKPWTYCKEDRSRSIRVLIERQDREAAKRLGVPVSAVQQLRQLVTTGIPTVVSLE
jgi:hypothetical protein